MTAISYSAYHHGNGGASGNEGCVAMVSNVIVYDRFDTRFIIFFEFV